MPFAEFQLQGGDAFWNLSATLVHQTTQPLASFLGPGAGKRRDHNWAAQTEVPDVFKSKKKSQHVPTYSHVKKSDVFSTTPAETAAIPIWMLHPTNSERAGWHESCYGLDFFCFMFFLLSYYCVFDENTVEETDES